MKTRIISVIVCLCILIGIAAGCETKEEAALFPTEEIISEIENDSEGENGSLDFTGGNDLETAEAATVLEKSHEVTRNALGMPLMDDTVLLVTVRKHYFSDDYSQFVEQYEYDSEGRMLRHLKEGAMKYSNMEFEYDSNGNLYKETCYDEKMVDRKWKLSYRIEYSYAEYGADKQVSRTEREYDADGSLSRESVYDSEDKLLKEIRYRENVLCAEYEYDSLENQSWESFYDEQGNLISRRREVYDDAGNQTLYVVYDAEGNIDVFEGYECDTYVRLYFYRRYENTYDDYGNLMKRVEYDYEGNETEIRGYLYNEKGNLMDEFFSDEMLTQEYEYTYDDAGNCIRRLIIDYGHDDAGNLTARENRMMWEKKYDEKNRLIKYIYYWGEPKCWYEYTYRTIGISDVDYPYDRIEMWQPY